MLKGNIYDNGERALGYVKDMIKYFIENSEESWEVEDLIQELNELNEDDIVVVDYDFGMGYMFHYWKQNDLIK